MKTVNMYTDGACAGNQNEENVGGWGCILEYAGREKELHCRRHRSGRGNSDRSV